MSELKLEAAVVDRAFSLSAAARECPERLFVRMPGRDVTYAEAAGLAREAWIKLREEGLPPPGRPLLLTAKATLECVVEKSTINKPGMPMASLPPARPHFEREALLHDMASIREPLPERSAVVIFTSGTTGRPKPAVLSREALFASACSGESNIALAPGDLWQMSISPARIGGLSIVTRTLRARSALSLPGPFDAETFCARLEEDGASFVSIVPTMLVKILERHPGWKAPKTLRALLLGGASATPALLERARRAGIPVMTTYGMTETASNVVTTPYEERLAGAVGSGRVNEFAEVRIEEGHIFVRGPMRMTGYWGREPLDADAWFPSGDLGFFDDQGYLHVLARRSDLIVSGGNNVYPAEVEAALEAIPGVRQALVLGKPDDTWGAIVTALLVAEGDPVAPEILVRKLAERLSDYKRPRRIAWVASLPTNAGGKLCRSPSVLEGIGLVTLHHKHPFP